MFKMFCLKEIKTENIKTFHSNHKNLAIKFIETVTSILYCTIFQPAPTGDHWKLSNATVTSVLLVSYPGLRKQTKIPLARCAVGKFRYSTT